MAARSPLKLFLILRLVLNLTVVNSFVLRSLHIVLKGIREMGLDMFLNGEKYLLSSEENGILEDGFPLKTKSLEVGYWRKHPNLHGYIVKTFAGGKDNCQDIELSEDDITKIIGAVRTNSLPETTGFFFGVSDDSQERVDEDINILESAANWLKTKEPGVMKSIIYKACW